MPLINLTKQHYDVIIIGGGAAGLFCAFQAALRGHRVALLEHNERVGKKIEISGGGRCNFTNIHASAENYLSENPNFCKSALARYSPWDFIALVEKHRIAYHEKKLGQQFCDGNSRALIEMLLRECQEAGVTLLTSCSVQEVKKSDYFEIITQRGTFFSKALVIATGGLSFSKLGATDFGYRIAKQFGIAVTPLRPGLVPLTYIQNDRSFCSNLAGVALPVRVQHEGVSFEEALLFTHRGVSGPAILQISSFWRAGQELSFNLLPSQEATLAVLKERKSNMLLANILSHHLPRRFAEAWCERQYFTKPAAHYSEQEFQKMLNLLHCWPLPFSGTEGYPKAEVTLGGVSTSELSSKTMEARQVPGLYFIGEVVDVTGWLGGYNFQWAWASAHAAAEAL
ncbi:MAG: NAD(P)/FAD-dependent oxidoreductase [Chthoniobacterales bacterium]|nr:NAD(P)/FAD-dependent oxidoreductase [Chthoniobacterales bacterium]